MWTLFRIALRNVARNRRRTAITLAALLVGVSVLITIRGLLTGLQNATAQGVVQGQTGAFQVHRKGFMQNVLSPPLTRDLPADEAFLGKIRAVPGVTGLSPRIQFAGMISSGDDTLFMAATGVDPVREFEVCPLRKKTLEGSLDTEDGVILTKELAKAAKVQRGVDSALLAPDRDGALNGENVKLVGTMTLNFPGERKVGLVPLALAQRLLRMEGRATEIIVGVADLNDVQRVAGEVRTMLGPEYEVHTWDDIATFVKQTSARQNSILSLIASVFMILMLLGVANTMLMSVLERTREVGTMMAIGVRRSKIVSLFLLEAAGIGVVGGFVGNAIGAGLVAWMHVRGLEVTAPGQSVPFTIRPEVTPEYLFSVLLIAATGAVVFAIYPAWRASRLRPVEALAGQ